MNLRPRAVRAPKNIEYVPATFKFQDPNRYPQDNTEDFEWWLARNLFDKFIPEGLTYLPITWTAYYKKCNYAADPAGMAKLQNFIDGLDDTKKYFTICQWDDGIRNDVSRLNLFQFNMGTYGDYQLPLICQPHQWQFPGVVKDIPVSFIGRVTHPIRQMIIDRYSSMPRWYISTQHHGLPEFCKILARSKYVLCPRGYGLTSFRIAEALQYGAHPIYISDQHLAPHDLGILWYAKSEDNIVKEISETGYSDLDAKANKALYNSYFTYEANKNLIIEKINELV